MLNYDILCNIKYKEINFMKELSNALNDLVFFAWSFIKSAFNVFPIPSTIAAVSTIGFLIIKSNAHRKIFNLCVDIAELISNLL